MSKVIRKIEERPVRFAFLVEALIALALTFGLQLTIEQFGAIMVALNALLAFMVENFTTAIDIKNGEPLSDEYIKSQPF